MARVESLVNLGEQILNAASLIVDVVKLDLGTHFELSLRDLFFFLLMNQWLSFPLSG